MALMLTREARKDRLLVAAGAGIITLFS